MTRSVLLFLSFALLTSESAWACYWDSDTLAMEKRRFPEVIPLISGKFARHSQAFYLWRIEDRRASLAEAPEELPLQDDLAVALEKTGQAEEAIRIVEAQLEAHPKRYESHANLGTFLIHAGRFEAGLEHIKAAIEINPDAHFGREIIQQRLVEYVLEIRARSPKRPLPLNRRDRKPVMTLLNEPEPFRERVLEPNGRWMSDEKGDLFSTRGFAKFMEARGHTREASLKGVLGMMRFGQHTHPILLEALGDLLLWDRRRGVDAKRLAARAYLSAAEHSEDQEAKRWYQAKAAISLVGHRRLSLSKVQKRWLSELKRGERHMKKIERDERRWIREGRAVEICFENTWLKKRHRGQKCPRRR